jgi:hypothetical protein
VADTIKQLAVVSPPMLCLLCDGEFGAGALPVAFVMLTAHRDDPSACVMNGLCLGMLPKGRAG